MVNTNVVEIKSVSFNGTGHGLKALLHEWNALSTVAVDIRRTDHVGGSFDVKFSRTGKPIERREAENWVNRALAKQ